MREPVITDRLYLQELEGGYRENILEYLRICMDEESFEIFMEKYKKNPFIVTAFYYIVPKLFHDSKKSENESKKKPTAEKELQTGIAALMARKKDEVKEVEDEEGDNTPFMDFVVNFLSKTEQNFSEMDRLRYTQIINISKSMVANKKREDAKKNNGDSVPIETVTTKLGGKE